MRMALLGAGIHDELVGVFHVMLAQLLERNTRSAT